MVAAIRDSGARLRLLSAGAPRQDRFAAFAAPMLPQVGFASVGARLDFRAGLQRRAPGLFAAGRWNGCVELA